MRILDNISIVQDPIHPGVVILEKLITDLKAKLPTKKGKAGDDELEEQDEVTDPSRDVDRTNLTSVSDEEEVSPKDNSIISKLKGKIKGLNKKSAASDEADDETEETSDADASKKKKSKIIQIVIVTGLVLFLVSDYIIPTEEEPAAPVSSFKKPERKKPVKTETAAVEKPAEVTEPAPSETPSETTAPTENPTETAATEVTTETTPDSPVTVTSETPTETSTVTEPTTEPTSPSTPDENTAVVTEPTPTPSETTTTPVDQSPIDSSNATVDSIDGTTTPKNDENLTDQILQDLEKQAKKDQVVKEKKEYVAPPDYEYRGRGLVYNCKGKHWACIDAPSYKICEDNASSVKFANKRTECHPFNVYETPRGCESMQNRMVSSSAKTNFCDD